MTFYVENETDYKFDFDCDLYVKKVAQKVLEVEGCPYDISLNVLITDNEGIKEYNSEYRKIDKETDVLSFPNVDYDAPSDFSIVEKNKANYFDPETNELLLGDIIISYERVLSQADEYGHSTLREFAFLVAHSMHHLLGYDHMVPEEASVMESKQENILNLLGITREA